MANRVIEYKNREFNISYEILNIKNQNTILFLHGWGSNKEIMREAFKKTLPSFKLLFIDMPGFGKSLTNEILKTKDYKNIIEQFIKELNISPLAIIGHSFGGKVATLLNPKNLILLSSAGILEKKPLLVKIKIKIFKILKFFGGEKLYRIFATKDAKDMPKNMYETLKNVVNEDFEKEFENFENRALIFWGEEDRATSLKSGKTISKLIKNSFFKSYQGDHYFFIKNSSNIAKEIEQNLVIS